MQFDVPDDVLPAFQRAQTERSRIGSARFTEIKRLQQIGLINVALSAIETLAIDGHSAIESFSVEADALELLRQTFERVGVRHVPEFNDGEILVCDLSSAIRGRSMQKRLELESDPGFRRRTQELMQFSNTHAQTIENDSLSAALKAKYQSLNAAVENDMLQLKYVHYMWLLAALNDMSVVIRDSNLIDADRYDGDPSKLGLHIDELRSRGEISPLQWEIGRHWILFNSKYDINDYRYGEFSGWDSR